jgi:ammonia channel protein AmtB
MEILKSGSDVLFILLGAIMVLAMHAGFAFLELGTVRKKNQVNALVNHRLLFYWLQHCIRGEFFLRR